MKYHTEVRLGAESKPAVAGLTARAALLVRCGNSSDFLYKVTPHSMNRGTPVHLPPPLLSPIPSPTLHPSNGPASGVTHYESYISARVVYCPGSTFLAASLQLPSQPQFLRQESRREIGQGTKPDIHKVSSNLNKLYSSKRQ